MLLRDVPEIYFFQVFNQVFNRRLSAGQFGGENSVSVEVMNVDGFVYIGTLVDFPLFTDISDDI